jgi:hypothetical protein
MDKTMQIDKMNKARKRPAGWMSMSGSVFTGSFAFISKESFGLGFRKAMEISAAE